MGINQSIQKCNFEDIQQLKENNRKYLLINTLDKNNQDILIDNTININNELEVVNNYLERNDKNIFIFVYGKNSNDENIYKKYKQLLNLGFKNTYIYIGGLFEWLCLYEIYGEDEFPCIFSEKIKNYNLPIDILKYKPITNIIH
jgi:rhodanese-related sulfurtransferase